MTISVRGNVFPFELIRERRRSWRISLGRDAIRMRLPLRSSEDLSGDPRTWAAEWLEKQYDRKPQLFERYLRRAPVSGTVYQTIFGSIVLQLHDGKQHVARGAISPDGVLNAAIPPNWSEQEKAEYLPKLVSKVMAGSLRKAFVRRVEILNSQHYQFDYRRISLKYNHSNWGSCSAKKNLNFSTRLFLVPLEVADYVIIHELAHLKILNHSQEFWRLVESACPEYKRHVRWLREEGAHMDF